MIPAEQIPGPRRGGTWLYCPWEQETDGGISWCMFRTRRGLARFRRHWRRTHPVPD